jgi:MFS transporter, OFA family, oxalate/formate antiporter
MAKMTGETHDAAHTGWRWWQLFMGVVCMVAAANIQYGWTLFVPAIQKDMKAELSAVQWAFTIFVLVQTWLTPFEGYLIDRVGPRIMVIIGGLCTGLAWVMYSQAQTINAFYVGAVIAGIGVGCVYATCINNAIKWFPDKRGLAVGLTAGGYGAGSALTIIPIDAMVQAGKYRDAFFQFGIIQGAVIMVAALFLFAPRLGQVPASQTIAQTRHQYTLMQAMATPLFWLLFAMFILTVTGGLMAVAQLKPMAVDLGVDKTKVDLGFIVMAALPLALFLDRIMNGVSRPLFGAISDRIGRENTMFIAFMMEGLGIVALAKFGTNPLMFVLLSGLVFLAWGEVYSLFSATSADAFGTENIGSIYGVLYCAKGVAALLIPFGSDFVKANGWTPLLYGVACMDILAAICAVLLLKPVLRAHHRRYPATAAPASAGLVNSPTRRSLKTKRPLLTRSGLFCLWVVVDHSVRSALCSGVCHRTAALGDRRD